MLALILREPIRQRNGAIFRIEPGALQPRDLASALPGQKQQLHDRTVRISLLLGSRPDFDDFLVRKGSPAALRKGQL
jgi:hypothetical protein